MGSVPYERGDEKADQVRMIELSTRYDPLAIEPPLQELWCERKRFSPSLDEGAARFSMVIPPPNVTGLLHIGHALNATLQDILARYKRLRGYDVLWLPGVDHAGIATQFVVERDLLSRGIDPRTLSKEGLIGEILAYKERHGNQIFAQLKSLAPRWISRDPALRWTMGFKMPSRPCSGGCLKRVSSILAITLRTSACAARPPFPI